MQTQLAPHQELDVSHKVPVDLTHNKLVVFKELTESAFGLQLQVFVD